MITVQKDPRTKKEIIIAEGEVKAIYVNELKEVKTYNGGKGGAWTPTHRISVNIDGDVVFLGLTDKENEIEFSTFNVKDADDNWQEVEAGDTVSAIVEESGEYKGKKQYSGRKSDIVLLEKGDTTKKPSKADTVGKGKVYDSNPIEAGNARSCATNWITRGKAELESFNTITKDFLTITTSMRKKYKETMSGYEAGVSVGQAALAASLIVDNIKEVEDFIKRYIEEYIPSSMEFFEEKVSKTTPTKNKTAKKEETPVEEYFSDEADDLDSIPF